jgi:hypothetical protein
MEFMRKAGEGARHARATKMLEISGQKSAAPVRRGD